MENELKFNVFHGLSLCSPRCRGWNKGSRAGCLLGEEGSQKVPAGGGDAAREETAASKGCGTKSVTTEGSSILQRSLGTQARSPTRGLGDVGHLYTYCQSLGGALSRGHSPSGPSSPLCGQMRSLSAQRKLTGKEAQGWPLGRRLVCAVMVRVTEDGGTGRQ